MKRAIVTFIENKKHLLLQFYCLYASIKEINCKDTDLVVFCPKDIIDMLPNDCIKIECEAASKLKIWQNYYFINSVECLSGEKGEFLKYYDYVIRSDADTFFTPAWNNFYPQLYTVGQGGYVNDDYTREKLMSIANTLGLRHQGKFNLGSTNYGNGALVKDVCNLTTFVARYILDHEFKENEGEWPGWYRGVILLYANEIAINHMVDDVIVDGEKLDFGSASNESIYNHPHIHCWHTNDIFSKFTFEHGGYDNIKIEDLNSEIVCDYCTYIALKSKQFYEI